MLLKLTTVIVIISVFQLTTAIKSAACNFKWDMCGWTNDNDTQLQWNRAYCDYMCTNYMAALPTNESKVGDQGRLFSPVLQGSPNQNCSLKFRFHLERPDVCRLMVMVKTQGVLMPVWESREQSGYLFTEAHGIQIMCSASQFQIVFEGEQKKNESCGKAYNGMAVIDIELSITEFDTSSDVITPKTATIVVAVVVVVVVAIVVGVLVWKKRRRMRGRVNTWVRSFIRKASSDSVNVEGTGNFAFTNEVTDVPLDNNTSQCGGDGGFKTFKSRSTYKLPKIWENAQQQAVSAENTVAFSGNLQSNSVDNTQLLAVSADNTVEGSGNLGNSPEFYSGNQGSTLTLPKSLDGAQPHAVSAENRVEVSRNLQFNSAEFYSRNQGENASRRQDFDGTVSDHRELKSDHQGRQLLPTSQQQGLSTFR